MIQENQLIVRKSWLVEGMYYIDCMGHFEIPYMADATGIGLKKLKKIYEESNGEYSSEYGVYYFSSKEDAIDARNIVLANTKSKMKERHIALTDQEIEYIRRALINENSNVIHLGAKVKDSIFKKLNK